ncbi:hypothetical protein BH23ACT1_BH23ACT1_06480 [soil metagenome]
MVEPANMIRGLVRRTDPDRPSGRFLRTALDKVFPDHWSFLLGEIALYSFVVLVVTGVFLALLFDASGEMTIYDGSYGPLQGEQVTRAYASVLALSFDVRAGLLVRQTHHWAALVFTAAIVVHACRVFFTGAFRRPRRLNWAIGVSLLGLSLANGWFGLSLPGDLLSGTGLRIGWSTALAVPVVGPALAFLVFAGEFPAEAMLNRLFWIHVLILPLAIGGLLSAHMVLVIRHTHTQFAGGRRREVNVVGDRAWPAYAAKTIGLFLLVACALVALGGLVQVNPIWLYGPFDPAAVTVPAQPDWYLGWIEGSLRVFPTLSVSAFGYELPSPFFSGVLLPLAVFAVLFSWPWIEARVTGDRGLHHLLDRPRDNPMRTALGVGSLAFLTLLLGAGSHDLQGQRLGVGVDTMTVAYRVLLVTVPPAAALVAWRACRDLRCPIDRQPVATTPVAPRAVPTMADSSLVATCEPAPRRMLTVVLTLAGAALSWLVHRRRRTVTR